MPQTCLCSAVGGVKMGWIYPSYYTDGTEIPERLPNGLGNPDFGRAIMCACQVAEHEKRYGHFLRQEANLPVGEWVFSDYRTAFSGEPKAILDARIYARDTVKAWCSGRTENAWLFLHGPAGTGKTYLAATAVNALLGAKIQARYEYVPDLIDRLRAGQADNSYGEEIARLKGVQVLVLDDLNATRSTEWAEGEVLKLIDWRYRERGPLLVTTNVQLEDIEPRTLDRLCDRFLSKTIPMIWASYRRG